MNSEEYYHSLLRFGMKPGLERVGILLDRLSNPQDKLRFVHVAGSNGKGSVCTFVAGVLSRAGYRTGLYTSPYVIDFRERIRVDGEMISPEELESITCEVKRQIDALSAQGIVITEFEAVTAAAFLYYSQKKCDIVVLETGLGGRFDATNVIKKPLCSCITSISLDHVKILGDTLSQIAFEKCGIIKPGSPCVTFAQQSSDALCVIKAQAESKGSPLYIADENNVKLINSDITGSDVCCNGLDIHIPFPGKHQRQNLAVALECIRQIKNSGFNISDDAIKSGVASCFIPARCEIISKEPLVILDGCHNDGSTLAFAELLKNNLRDKKIHALMGMMADKNCEKAISNLVPLFSSVTFVKPSNPRSAEPCELARIAEKYCLDVSCCGSIDAAVGMVKDRLSSFDDVMVVCGSLYLASDVRDILLSSFGE